MVRQGTGAPRDHPLHTGPWFTRFPWVSDALLTQPRAEYCVPSSPPSQGGKTLQYKNTYWVSVLNHIRAQERWASNSSSLSCTSLFKNQ